MTHLPSPDAQLNAAINAAAKIPDEEIQRRILVHLYLQNAHLKAIKGHLTFYTIFMIISFVLLLVVVSKG